MDKYMKAVLTVIAAFAARKAKFILRATIAICCFGLVGCQTVSQLNNGKIREDGRGASLERKQEMFVAYTYRGAGGTRYNSFASESPREIKPSLIDFETANREMQRSSLVSYMVVQDGALVVDLKSPQDRFGKILDEDPFVYSMSLGKSLAGYLMGHAICKGYIESVDQKLSDWPLVENTLISEVSVRDVINASMGHQNLMKNNETFRTGFLVQGSVRDMLALGKLYGAKPSQKRHEYGQLPANIALNYIAHKTGYKFKEFSNDVLQNHVRLERSLKWAHSGNRDVDGNIHANFNATREDTLRIGMAILDDWNQDNCVGKYLKDIYQKRARKNPEQQSNTGWGRARAYAGFFHTDYQFVDDTVMGMDGYGGISMLINFDKNRIVYAHAVARDYDHRKLIFDAVSDGL